MTKDQNTGSKAQSVKFDRDELPYRIELWNEQGTAIERVLGRAASVSLARAIFRAAEIEHAGRVITLKHLERVVARTGAPPTE